MIHMAKLKSMSRATYIFMGSHVKYDSCKNVTAKYEWAFSRHVPVVPYEGTHQFHGLYMVHLSNVTMLDECKSYF